MGYLYKKLPRLAIIKDSYALIPLGKDAKDGYATVDLEFVWIDKYLWVDGKTNGGYAVSTMDSKLILMHRLIMSAPKGKQVDHINGNPRDNRTSNLRLCDAKQQSYNKSHRKHSSARYTGIEFINWSKKYRARIRKDGKRYSLGCYKTQKEAARAYNKAAIQLFGEFARLNNV